MAYSDQVEQKASSIWVKVKSWPWARIVFYSLIAVGAIVGGIWLKKMFWPVAPVNTTPQVLAEAPKAANVERIYIPGPTKILIYNKEELAAKIPMPPAVVQNPNNQFTATAAVPSSPYGGTAVAFTNTSSGVTNISYTAKPRPIFGWGGDGGVSIRGGVGAGNSSSGYTGGVAVRQKIIRVSAVQVSAVGELNLSTYQKPEGKALVEVELFSWR
jgi:hypothetical protein